MLNQMTDESYTEPFTTVADPKRVERTAMALEKNGFVVEVVADAAAARDAVTALLQPGEEVHQGSSVTLEEVGLTELIARSGRYDAIQPKVWGMDRATQMREIRKLSAAPDVMLGSVNAVTETGSVAIASATGSQLGPYASGAGRVIWVIGAQKIVADVEEALRRIEEHALPLENARSQEAYGRPSDINKLLLVNREPFPGRTTAILVNQALGF